MWKLNATNREAIFDTAEKAIDAAISDYTEVYKKVKNNTYKSGLTSYPSWQVVHMLRDKHSKLIQQYCDSYNSDACYRISLDVEEIRGKHGITEDRPSES